ncbi:hypothetical protein [Brachyspira alvinipulli]|uniref:hypothetical protein n=1 Tax=Brachyspira alvinipulli TaxID=84379 RepID=UPI0004819365|nr:hypothetical protein [Brachyspira alvinipulli]
MGDFELKKSTRSIKKIDDAINPEIVKDNNSVAFKGQNADKLINAAADNFDSILQIASDIVSIQKIKAQSEAIVRELDAKGNYLIKEAQAYVAKKEADTNQTIKKMEVVRLMMKDFYEHAPSNITGDEFSKIIIQFIDKIDKFDKAD